MIKTECILFVISLIIFCKYVYTSLFLYTFVNKELVIQLTSGSSGSSNTRAGEAPRYDHSL